MAFDGGGRLMQRRGFLGLIAGLPAVAAVGLGAQADAKPLELPPIRNDWSLVKAEVLQDFASDVYHVALTLRSKAGSRALRREVVTAEEIMEQDEGRFHHGACSHVNVIFWRDRTWIPVRPTVFDLAVQIAWNRTRPYYYPTRLHRDDAAGHVLEAAAPVWPSLRLPV